MNKSLMWFVVVAVVATGCGRQSGSVPAREEILLDLGGGVKLEMVLIPAGEFQMGSPDSDSSASSLQRPQHRVRITKPFFLGKYEVTQEQWAAVMGDNPSRFKSPKKPVERVSWHDCQRFMDKLNAKLGAGHGRFALPTEAQWEYACRAGSTTRYFFGNDDRSLGTYAWYSKNSGDETHPVGEKEPNAWGLYDMYGNVDEWCQDWFGDDYYAHSPTDDPPGPEKGTERTLPEGMDFPEVLMQTKWGAPRVTRGGYYCWDSYLLGSACRGDVLPGCTAYYYLGFRVALIPADK